MKNVVVKTPSWGFVVSVSLGEAILWILVYVVGLRVVRIVMTLAGGLLVVGLWLRTRTTFFDLLIPPHSWFFVRKVDLPIPRHAGWTPQTVAHRIDQILLHESKRWKEHRFSFQQASTPAVWKDVHSYYYSSSNEELVKAGDQDRLEWKEQQVHQDQLLDLSPITPFYFGFGLYEMDFGKSPAAASLRLVGMATFYMAFSTCEGRMMVLDRFHCGDGTIHASTLRMDQIMLTVLSRIAVSCDCPRLMWRFKRSSPASWYYQDEGKTIPQKETVVSSSSTRSTTKNREFPSPDVLRDRSTMSMNTTAMKSLVLQHPMSTPTRDIIAFQKLVQELAFAPRKEEEKGGTTEGGWKTIQRTLQTGLNELNLQQQQQQQTSDLTLKLADLSSQQDAEIVLRLVQGLAEYEKEQNAVTTTWQDYQRDGGGDFPLFHVIFLQQRDKYVCGMALVSFEYHLPLAGVGDGHPLCYMYLEALFVEPNVRKKGGGTLLFHAVARSALALTCPELRWVVFDWNQSAIRFYHKMGARSDIQLARYSGHRLQEASRFVLCGESNKL